MIHKVYIVGAGAGGLDSLTIKAKHLIENYAEIVIHDRLISPEIINLIPQNVEKIFAGKEPDLHHMKQDEINDFLVKQAKLGKKIVRLKGGDPFIFGRGGEEIEILHENKIPYEVVAGITAAISASAQELVPLTYRNLAEGVIFITGHNYDNEEPKLEYDLLAKTNYTIAIYMGIKNISVIAKNLIKSGKSKETKVLAVSNAGEKNSVCLFSDLENIADEINQKNLKNPAIIYIGDVVKISQKLKQSV